MTTPGRSSGDLRRTVRLFRRFMGRPKLYAVGFALLVVEALTSVVEPYPIAYLVDYLQGAKPDLRELGAPVLMESARWETILLLTVGIVLLATVNSAADSLTEVCMARAGRSLGYSIRVAMYAHLQRLPLAYHDKKRTGDVLTRVTGDVLVLEDFLVKSVSNILGSLLVLLGSFGFLLYQSWKVAIVAVVAVPLLAVVSNHYSRRIKVASKTQRDREGDLASTTQEMLTSIRLVQSYGRGAVDLGQFSHQTEMSMHASVRAANIQAQFSFVIALTEALAICAVVWLGVWLFDRGALTIGTLVLFVLLLQNMFKPARKIVSEWYKIGKVFASVERIQDLLDRDVVVADLPGAVPAPRLEGRLAFRHVSFTYPAEDEQGSKLVNQRPVLDDVDFEVAPGEVLAIVGHSGAGKSTIAQLVPRLYDTDSGEVLVDGVPVTGFTLASLRAQVSVVLQDTVLLSGTVAENIAYGIADATREDIETAARLANAHDFIENLPEGYATVLGERGSTLSGGQRQRLAIARAFVRRAPILILDEPTTGLDGESAQSVVAALRDLMRGTTSIVISHDEGLIRCADRILVISQGRIVEEGPLELLRSAGGTYAGLFPADALPVGDDAVTRADTTSWTTSRLDSKPGSRSTHAGSPMVNLSHRLPGLEKARDPEFVTSRIVDVLGWRTTAPEVSVDKFWLREDGSCALRYQVRHADESDGGLGLTVLGCVHPDTTHDNQLSLFPFPHDPHLPTLARAVDPRAVAALAPIAGRESPPAVAVVHHPRQGACVLQYRWPQLPGPSEPSTIPTLYGKVYPDGRGEVIEGFMRALVDACDRNGRADAAAFPRPVLYEPTLRLLLTEAVAGEPRVPRLLTATLGGPAPQKSAFMDELKAAVRESGRALAVLHGSDLATAPVHSVFEEIADVRQELGVVEDIWPQAAEQVRNRLDMLTQPPSEPVMVLSHGDFTPSQVLLEGGSAGVVDLDTLCWADPALDLGRYLAHLRLKAFHINAEAAGAIVDDLTAEFLDGYASSSPRAAATTRGVGRIEFYSGTTLARTALRGLRRLKQERFELAGRLLEEIHARKVDQ